MKFINLTPHEIHEVSSGMRLPSVGLARVKAVTKKVTSIEGVDIYRSEFEGALEGLPKAHKGVIYIVSALALNAVPADRTDVVAPGNLVRDAQGQPVGCQGFRCR